MNRIFALTLLTISLVPAFSDAQAIKPKVAKGQTLLFVDDHDVLYRSGTKLVVHPAKRHSENALIDRRFPWETAIGWTSVYRDPESGIYQLWYQAYIGHRAGDRRYKCVVCYAESKDGIHFERPMLDLFPYRGEKSNIVLIGNGGYGDRYCCSVLVDDNEPDAKKRYKMAYYDWSTVDGREYAGLHVAFSPDGIHWTKHPEGPLYKTSYGSRGQLPPFDSEEAYKETVVDGKVTRKAWHYPITMSDAVDVFWDPIRQVFVIIGKFWLVGPEGKGAWKHGVGRSESKDFLHWSKPRFLLAPDDRDPPALEFHTSPVFYHKGRYISLIQLFDRKAKGAIDIELMTSLDGFVWERNFRDEYFLARSKHGLFDSRSIFTNSTPIILDDEIRFYYGAYNQSPLGGVRAEPGQRSGVGMVSIPMDRFAGIRPVAKSAQVTLRRPLENIGQVTLKPLDLNGCEAITLNADAGAGSVRVDVLDEDGYRVRGFSGDDSVVLRGDSLRHEVRWEGKSLKQLPPGNYMLRIYLDNATLYAISFR